MKVVSVFGSPRKKGNTAIVLNWMDEAFTEAGHEVERIHVAGYKLNGCVSCYRCQTDPEEFTCVQKDDANEIYAKMRNADAVVLASPLYWWTITAQLKPLWDRLMCQIRGMPPGHRSALEGKPVAFVMTCWGPVENNAEAAVELYKRSGEYLLTDDRGTLVVPGCGPTGAPGEQYKAQARDLALKIVA